MTCLLYINLLHTVTGQIKRLNKEQGDNQKPSKEKAIYKKKLVEM